MYNLKSLNQTNHKIVIYIIIIVLFKWTINIVRMNFVTPLLNIKDTERITNHH